MSTHPQAASNLSSPPSPPLAEQVTLAMRVQQARQARNLTREALAELADIHFDLLEEIEESKLTFLSHVQRSRLARALKLETDQLRVLERWVPQHTAPHADDTTLAEHRYDNSPFLKRLPIHEMLRHPEGFWPCPSCGAALQTHSFPRETLEGIPLLEVKIRCSQCLFSHREEVSV